MDATWNVEAVGRAAGKVWQYLRSNGQCSVTAVEKGVEMPSTLVHMALGWLAREGKLAVEQDKRSVRVSLSNGA